VSDQGFNFTPPSRREAKKAFEPPPWEQEQFDELARRKQTETPVDEVLVEVAEDGKVTADTPAPEAPVPTGPKTAGPQAEEDLRIEAMLLGLKDEEPEFGTELWKASLAAGAVLVAVGTVLAVWGVFATAAARKTGAIGLLGGGILVVFGVGFAGVGGWMAFRILRQRGVL